MEPQQRVFSFEHLKFSFSLSDEDFVHRQAHQQSSILLPHGKRISVGSPRKITGVVMTDGETSTVHNLNQNMSPPVLEKRGFNGNTATFYEDKQYNEEMAELYRQLDLVKQMVKPGCSVDLLDAALTSLASLVNFLDFMSSESKILSFL